MKKIIIMLLLAVASVYAFAQTPKSTEMQYFQMGKRNAAGTVVAVDTTLTGGADTTYLYFDLNGACDLIAKATLTKSGGTLGGNAVFQGSKTGTWSDTWYTIKSNETDLITGQFTEDTATIANATTTYEWIYPSHKFKSYRIRFITTGGAGSPTGTVYYRKNDD